MATRTYSPAQLAYLAARAAYDVAKADADAVMAAYEAMCDEKEATLTPSEFEAWQTERRSDPPNPILVAQCEALAVRQAAERALLDWCVAKVAPLATTPKQRADLEAVRTCKPWLGTYAKALDLAMRLEA
jgi:hypothetical protein